MATPNTTRGRKATTLTYAERLMAALAANPDAHLEQVVSDLAMADWVESSWPEGRWAADGAEYDGFEAVVQTLHRDGVVQFVAYRSWGGRDIVDARLASPLASPKAQDAVLAETVRHHGSAHRVSMAIRNVMYAWAALSGGRVAITAILDGPSVRFLMTDPR